MKDEPTPLFWVLTAVMMTAGAIGVAGWILDRSELAIPGMAAFFLVAAVGGAGRQVRYWRGETRESRMIRPPAWWKWSPGLWRANVRTTPVMAAGAVPMMATAALLLSIRELAWPGPPEALPWYETLEGLFVLVWVGVPGLAISVALFNRPQVVVPPHMRAQPGLLHGGNDDPTIGAEEHRTPGELGLKGHFPEGRFGDDE